MILDYYVPFSSTRKLARFWSKMTVRLRRLFPYRRKLLTQVGDDWRSIDYKSVPVIINNYNRLEWLIQLISWFEKAGMEHIYIIDNSSTYSPLLAYYEETKHTVIRLSANLGYKAYWDTKVCLWFKGLPYVYTDPDVFPNDATTLDVVKHLLAILKANNDVTKVGLALKIDDIPDSYQLKNEVLAWEQKYWREEVMKDVYKADIDTTLALYAPDVYGQQWGKTYRVAGRYELRHLPWYVDSNSISEEERYYRRQTIGSSWY